MEKLIRGVNFWLRESDPVSLITQGVVFLICLVVSGMFIVMFRLPMLSLFMILGILVGFSVFGLILYGFLRFLIEPREKAKRGSKRWNIIDDDVDDDPFTKASEFDSQDDNLNS